jgi:uncharacterized PurR-regulated membrane protein YhhQ (DUF165 family)
MPVLVALVFGLFCVAVVVALAFGDRTIRRIVVFSFLVALALAIWMFTAKPTNITNDPRPVPIVTP